MKKLEKISLGAMFIAAGLLFIGFGAIGNVEISADAVTDFPILNSTSDLFVGSIIIGSVLILVSILFFMSAVMVKPNK